MKQLAPTMLAFFTLAASPALARPTAHGWFAEGSMGAAGALGDAGLSMAIGPSLVLRGGYDLASWAAIGVQVAASSHEATVPAPPEGEWLQLYRGFAELRLTGRLGRLGLFATGGAGGAYMSSNVLEKVDIQDPGEHASLAVTGGAGIAYQLGNRHYAVGLEGDWWMLLDLASSQGVEGRAFLRYTF